MPVDFVRRFAIGLMVASCMLMCSSSVSAQTPMLLSQGMDKVSVIDITGNWRDGQSFYLGLQVNEPALKEGETKTFCQTLRLPAGTHAIELIYEPAHDIQPNLALGGKPERFTGLTVGNRSLEMKFAPDPNAPAFFRASADFMTTDTTTTLSLTCRSTRPLRTRLHVQGTLSASPGFAAVLPADRKENLLMRGIPFCVRRLDFYDHYLLNRTGDVEDRGGLRMWQAEGLQYDLGGQVVRKIHFLGMTHNIDIANGSWYSPKGDHGYNHFVGDTAGNIEIEFADGGKKSVPLVFGFNLWYGRPWDIIWHYTYAGQICGFANKDEGSFDNSQSVRALYRDGIQLQDAYRVPGSRSNNARYMFTLDVGDRPVRSIRVTGDPQFHGYPLISAITVETDAARLAGELAPLPELASGVPVCKPIDLAYVEREGWRPGVGAIMRNLYTYVDDLPVLREPQVTAGYFGPDYDFCGTNQAVYASTYLYRNGPECASFIADSGMGCSSPVSTGTIAQYVSGCGIRIHNVFNPAPAFGNMTHWFYAYQEGKPGKFGGGNNGWTRAVGELMREAMAFGYDKYINTYTDWLDRCLMTEANPPHWNRVAGDPNFCTTRRQVGDTEERGVRENDGHGICMWGRYMVWHWLGRPRDWNEQRFAATAAAVDWIRWQLDTDTLFPGKRKDVLYTESECAHGDYDIYSSFNCLHGIKLSIRMAQQLGKKEEVGKWQALYARLRQGILDNLIDQSEFGSIWHTYPHNDWQDHAHKLAPIHLATEGDTFTPLQDYAAGDEMDRKYLQISRNTYRYLMKEKNYNCLRMYGYGQGMMTQAALLLDEMGDAEQFLNMLVEHAYLPKFSGWASPEGIILHRSGKYYLPVNGYMGQDTHAADSTKALRLMLGVDDNNPESLRLVPRFPASWTRMSISRFPVLTGESRQKMDYNYSREENAQEFAFRFDRPPGNLSVRLGPLPAGKQVSKATLDDKEISFKTQKSGDSQWVWIKEIAGQSGTVRIELQNASLKTEQSGWAERFANPPADARILLIIHSWPGTPAECDTLIARGQARGFGGVVCNVNWKRQYLENQDEWKAFVLAIHAAKDAGLAMWLYDERGYPSGNAGGITLRDHPEWEASGLLVSDTESRGGPVSLDLPPGKLVLVGAFAVCDGVIDLKNRVDLSSQVKDRKLQWQAPVGRWRVMAVCEDRLFEGTHAEANIWAKIPYINLLMSEPTARFIDVTYGGYAKHLGDDLGKYFMATFTDEPSLMSLYFKPMPYRPLPWAPNLPGEFKNRRGYALDASNIPALVAEAGGAGEKIRHDFWLTVGELVSQNYFGQIQMRCRQLGIPSGGHLLMEERISGHVPLYGDFFRCIRRLDAPSIDCLTSLPQEVPWFIARLVSSAAELEGHSLVMSETSDHQQRYRADGDKRPKLEVTEAEIRGTCNRQMVAGVNCITSYYNFKDFSDEQLCRLNEWVGRCCTALRGGHQVADVAILYPVESLWTRFVPSHHWTCDSPGTGRIENLYLAAAESLFKSQRDFTFVDSRALAEAKVESDTLVHGQLRWRVVILPGADTLPIAAWENLARFVRKGGVVIALGALPANSESQFPCTQVQTIAREIFGQGAAGAASALQPHLCANAAGGGGVYLPAGFDGLLSMVLDSLLPPDVKVAQEQSPLRVMHRRIDKSEVYFVINDSAQPWTGRLDFAGDSVGEHWNPATGKQEGTVTAKAVPLSLEPYGASFFRFASSNPPQRAALVAGMLPKFSLRLLPQVEPLVSQGSIVVGEIKPDEAHSLAGSPAWQAAATLTKTNEDAFFFVQFCYPKPLDLSDAMGIAVESWVPEGQSTARPLVAVLHEEGGGDFIAETSRSLATPGKEQSFVTLGRFNTATYSKDADGVLNLKRVSVISFGWGGYLGIEGEQIQFSVTQPQVGVVTGKDD